jgi:sugar/nucleoside kinase (ribokinase family)
MKDIFVGLESSIDIWVSLDSIEDLLALSTKTKSGMESELKSAYECLRDNIGDEIPVDGRDLEVLIEELRPMSRMESSVGGGAAIQCSQFLSLGANAHYLGNYYPDQIRGTLFSKSDFSLGRPSGLNPRSVVLQIKGDRFILSSGRGRRIMDLRDYIQRLPQRILKAANQERPDAISLVGWHVLFAQGVEDSDIDLVISSLQGIEELSIPMFTDAGGFGKIENAEIKKLWKIYESFDILTMNEWEFARLSKVLSITGDEDDRLKDLMELGRNTNTVWLHTREYQKSISRKHDKNELSSAQEFASAAGCLRVETGGFPSPEEIERVIRPGRSFSSRGVVTTKGLRSRRVRSEVGAGDVSCASFLWKLLI